MELVMVEFDAGKEQAKGCIEALQNLMSVLVAEQKHFHGSTIYLEEHTGIVINAMKWDSHKDFIEFRDANINIIGTAIGKFNPNPRWLKITHEIESR